MQISLKQSSASILINFTQLFWGASYYGMFGLIVIYFTQHLSYSQEKTMMIVGALGALGPILSALGGLFCDRIFGAKRAIYVGYFLYTISYFLLAYAAYCKIDSLSLLSLSLICFARGLSNATPRTLIAKSYNDSNLKNLDSSYTYNYMINNLGSFFARISFPILVGLYSYSLSFALSGVLIFIDVILLVYYRKILSLCGTNPDFHPLNLKKIIFSIVVSLFVVLLVYLSFNYLDITKIIVYFLGILVFGYFIFEMLKQDNKQKKSMLVALILLGETFLFFIYFNLFYSGVIFFAINTMENSFLGFTFNPVSSGAFNPFWIVIFSPILAYIFNKLEVINKNPSIFIKFAIGMSFTTLSYFILYLSTYFMNEETHKISMLWLFVAHLFQAIAELLISALGISAIVKLTPQKSTGFVVGLQLVTLSVTSIIAAILSKAIALPNNNTLTSIEIANIYKEFFTNMSLYGLIAIIVIIGFIPLNNKILKNNGINKL